MNELQLFHGSRGNDPRLICEGEVGFDLRYSSQGRWGHANYFGMNASYCDKFAHSTTDGYKEIIVAKVLTGDSYDSTPDSSLRLPPLKQTSGQILFIQARYDTVTGVTCGCKVFMTYDNEKAYPAYIIKYSGK